MRKILSLSLIHFFQPIAFLAIIAAFFLQGEPKLLMQIVTTLAIIYVTIALIHHYFDKSLSLEVGLEYVLISLLAVLVVFGIAI